jgi:hypothetical protein
LGLSGYDMLQTYLREDVELSRFLAYLGGRGECWGYGVARVMVRSLSWRTPHKTLVKTHGVARVGGKCSRDLLDFLITAVIIGGKFWTSILGPCASCEKDCRRASINLANLGG